MLVLLLRHAEAADRDAERYPDDSVRPLVRKGEKIQRAVSKDLRKRKLIPDRVFSSPWKRAWQTARILVEETGRPKKARVACPALAGSPDLGAIGAAIGPITPDGTIALVGHDPWIGELAALLLTGKADGLRCDFAKSGVMGIDLDEFTPAGGTLRFFLRPS
jgi:phosphohistidine phosphatase